MSGTGDVMGRLTAWLVNRFRAWERPAKIGMALALALLALALLALVFGPPSIRQPVLIGVFGLLIAAQAIFMWANRGLVTPFTRAQRAYLAEDFEAARETLERLEQAGKADVRALTLLGNTYRQLGDLEKSEQVLTKALSLRPSDPFPLYGFGRTLLIRGFYAEAVEAIHRALASGAPPVVYLDLGEALFRQGQVEETQAALRVYRQQADGEPHRVLMADYLLYQLGAEPPPSRERLQAGLPFWQENARRFRHTPYGQSLAEDVRQMQALIEEA